MPYLSGSLRLGDQAGRTLFEYDPKPAFGGNHRRLLAQPNRKNESFLFTNWAGRKEYSAERPEEYSCNSQSPSIPVGNASPHRACRARAWQSMATGTAREHGSRCRQRHRNATPSVNIPFVVIMSSTMNWKARTRSNLPIRSHLIWAGSENSAKAAGQQPDKSL